MATIVGTRAMVYWGSTASPSRVAETRDITIDLGSEFADDTVHLDTNRTSKPTFATANIGVTGLYDNAAFAVIDDALAQVEGWFYVYPDSANAGSYFYGRGFASVDQVGLPFDDMAKQNWSIKPSSVVTMVNS